MCHDPFGFANHKIFGDPLDNSVKRQAKAGVSKQRRRQASPLQVIQERPKDDGGDPETMYDPDTLRYAVDDIPQNVLHISLSSVLSCMNSEL